MSSLLPLLAAFAALLHPAKAHGGLNNYTVGDTWYPGFDPNLPPTLQLHPTPQRQYNTIDPLFSPLDPHLSCNTPGTPSPSQSSIPILAGATLTAIYYHWIHPVGPMTVWLTRCGDSARDCMGLDTAAAPWFKIWEAGLLEGPDLATGTWYQKRFQNWEGGGEGRWEVRVPRGLRGGGYIVRHEVMSIHVERRAQWYVSCGHLEVSRGEGGGEGTVPPGEWMVRFPGVYREDDPSIDIDIYAEEMVGVTDYVIPGGRIWPGFTDLEAIGLGA